MESEASEEAEVYYEDYDTRAEVINQCYSALTALEYLDPYDKKGQEQKNRIKRKALDVLDYYISEIHAEIFDVTYEEED
jgi:hypothetical protein